uniref:JAZF zinc finger 1 n=1 Tax=Oryctolagus cuniculus TaxID=9986 RepID=G1T3Y7_RABIT
MGILSLLMFGIPSKNTDPRVLEKQELQQPTYVALSYINRFMTDAARREQESLKKKIQPKLSLTLSSSVSRGNVSTPPRHSSGSLTPPVTPPITPSSSFRSSTPTGSEYDEEEVDYEQSDSDESWTTESAISSEAILSSMCMNGGEEKPFACPVPGCKKRYKVHRGRWAPGTPAGDGRASGRQCGPASTDGGGRGPCAAGRGPHALSRAPAAEQEAGGELVGDGARDVPRSGRRSMGPRVGIARAAPSVFAQHLAPWLLSRGSGKTLAPLGDPEA